VSEAASTRAVGLVGTSAFELYRAKFDARWEMAPFAGQSTDLDAALDSRAPHHARPEHLQADLRRGRRFQGGLRRQRRSPQGAGRHLLGPAGLNLVDSPRLQRLGAAFLASPATVATPLQYATLRASVHAASALLDPADRRIVANSNEWQRLINEQVPDPRRRSDLATVIATPPPAPPPPGGKRRSSSSTV
jgi:hypothetical protein